MMQRVAHVHQRQLILVTEKHNEQRNTELNTGNKYTTNESLRFLLEH